MSEDKFEAIVGPPLRLPEAERQPPRQPGVLGRLARRLIRHANDTAVVRHDNFPSEEDIYDAIYEQRSEVLEDPSLRHNVRSTLVQRGDNPAADKKLLDSTTAITERFESTGFFEMPPSKQMLSYLSFCHAVDRIKIQATGADARTDRSNTLMQLVGARLGAGLHLDPESYKAYSAQTTHFLNVLSNPDSRRNMTWNYKNARFLGNTIDSRYQLRLFIHANVTNRGAKIDQETMDHDEATADELFGALLKRRKYGVKNSYTDASVGGSWVYTDGHAMVEKFKGDRGLNKNAHRLMVGGRSLLMLITHSTKDELESLDYERDDENVGFTQQAYLAAPKEFAADLGLFLHTDGELYLDAAGQIPIKQEFMAVGAYPTYRALLAEQMANFFDLSMPAQLVDEMTQANPSLVAAGAKDRDDPIKELLLPRLRYAKGDYPEEPNPQEVSLHGVVWHRRKLPNGWKASPEARGLAEEYGIVLEENETFVRPHLRGNESNGRVTGHHINKPRSKKRR